MVFTFFAKTQVAAKLPATDKNNPVSGLSITPTGIFANNFAVNCKRAENDFQPKKAHFFTKQTLSFILKCPYQLSYK